MDKKLKWVDIVAVDGEKMTGSVRARCILEGGKVRIEGDEAWVKKLNEGIAVGPNQKFTPEDGDGFLEALAREFRSAYLFATDVKEGDKVEEYEMPPLKDAVPGPKPEKPAPDAA